ENLRNDTYKRFSDARKHIIALWQADGNTAQIKEFIKTLSKKKR
ncbi:hypothetical protein MCHI_002717, partial [Candidatus Magnetoovum chiemensis]